MQKGFITISFCFLAAIQVHGQTLKKVSTGELLELTGKKNDTTYVVNFWATWCSPCVKEISYFEELHRQYPSGRLRVVLVSLDFPDQAERRVVPFLREKEITSQVLLMTDLNYNDWIDLVDPTWSGAIPATLIFDRNERIFLEREVTRDELFNYVNQIMN
jgi:thiol-disulfide isomerase/thioredoxin